MSSKVKHAAKWQALRAAGHNIISTWIDEAGEGDSPDLTALWDRNVRQAATCDLFILYYEFHDSPLKGCLIELGAAMSHNVPVALVPVGAFPSELTTAQYYRNLKTYASVEAAIHYWKEANS
jgi:hypothetical protein